MVEYLKILSATIYRGGIDLPMSGRSVEEAIHIKDRECGIASVKDAILHRLGAWPTNKATEVSGADTLSAAVQLAAMHIIDRAFVTRCLLSMSQIDSYMKIDSDTFEWL